MKRRSVIAGLGAGALAVLAYRYWPDEGFNNPCLPGEVPAELLEHEIVQAAWQGLDPKQVWDCHVHLVGAGPLPSTWLNPAMRSLSHPILNVQYRFYLDAACLNEAGDINGDYIQRLLDLYRSLAPGSKLMLLAFDYCHDNEGNPLPQKSLFYVSNDYTAQVAKRYPAQFEWIASIHPYRRDCLEVLDAVTRAGARAIKWLPPAMGIDPSSPRCDAFYHALAKSNLPLLTHGGDEHAVTARQQTLGNPLLLRRALDQGVRVIVAHCASLGASVDLDKGKHASPVSNFKLFSRLMDEERYDNLLYGDISALFQVNRNEKIWHEILARSDRYDRLINGSDYPLPAVMPLYSMEQLIQAGLLNAAQATVLSRLRRHNSLLFDFVLKRTVNHDGMRFAPVVFESARVFQN